MCMYAHMHLFYSARSTQMSLFVWKVWVQNSKPYTISLTLKELQQILNDDMPMGIETFNLVVQKNMFDNIQMVKNQRGIISKQYLDLKFWVNSYIHYLSIYIHTLILLITLFYYFICIIDNYGFWTTSGPSKK
jgi:ABC-type multidrug transport system permease subunit